LQEIATDQNNKRVERYVRPRPREPSRFIIEAAKLVLEMKDELERPTSDNPLVKSPGIWKVGVTSEVPLLTGPEGCGGRGAFEPECEFQNESYVRVELVPKLCMSLAVSDCKALAPVGPLCIRGRWGLTKG